MSHFFTIVLIEKECENIERRIEELLEKYNENLEMDRYIEYTKEELIEKNKKETQEYLTNGNYAEYIKDPREYENKYGKNNNHMNYIKNEFPKKLNWTDEEHYQDAIKYYDEDNIGVDGEVYSTYNPNSKWDWWVIGGRWDGIIKNNYQSSDNGFNFNDQHHTINNNIIEVKLINNSEQYPFAIVTPDGDWHEKGNMGWWCMVQNEKEQNDWNDMCNMLFNKYQDCWAVGCDMHI